MPCMGLMRAVGLHIHPVISFHWLKPVHVGADSCWLVDMPTFSVLHMARRPARFFEEMEVLGAKKIDVDKRLGLSSRSYDLSSVGFHARATAEDYDGHMVVVGDWQRYDLEDVEAALALGLLMQVSSGTVQKRVACLDYGLDAALALVDHACWDQFAAIAHTVKQNMKLVEVGTFSFAPGPEGMQ